MIWRYGLIAVVVSAMSLVAVATAVHEGDARASSGEMLVLSPGDRFRLDEAPIGCRIARLPGHGRQAFVDCRRAGQLEGTYGTYFGKSKVVVVRYLDARTARVVYQARHEDAADRCR